MNLLMCYLMAVPMILWALGLQFDLWTDDSTRVPYLILQALSIIVSVSALRARYSRDWPPR